MRRWIWRVLLLAAAVAALTVGVMAEEVILDGIKYDGGAVTGVVNKTTITTAHIAAEVNGVKITQIQDDAFTGCARLTSVEIGSNVTTIGSSAFNSCPILETVLFSDSVISIGKHAFANCGKLNKVVLPSALKKIEEGTFSNCGSLSSIFIASVSEIDWDAFSGTKVSCLHSATGDSVTQQDSPPLEVHRASQTPGIPTEPTCTEPGSREFTYNCNTCGTSFNFTQNRPIPPTGHSEKTVPFEGKDATCYEPGYEAGARCSVCNEVVEGGDAIDIKPDAHPEDMIKPLPGKEATCTEPGLTEGEGCAACGKVTKEQTEIEVKPHDMEDKEGEWEIVQDSTCTGEGTQRRQVKECSMCGEAEYETKSVDVKGHSYVLAETSRVIEYDCINGHISVKDWICERCGDEKLYFELCTEDEEDPEHEPEHEYSESDEITEEYLRHLEEFHGGERGKAGGHKPPLDAEYVVDQAATCTTEGIGRYVGGYTCTVCGEHIADEDGEDKTEVLPLLGHDWKPSDKEEDSIKTAPTCETKGERWVESYRCSRCDAGPYHGEDEKTEPIPALGHDWEFKASGGEMPPQAEGCADTPVKGTASCTRCGTVSGPLEFTIPGKLSHSWEWVPNADGETETQVCKNCQQTGDTRTISNSGGSDDDNTGGDGNEDDEKDDGEKDPGTTTPDTTSYRVDVIQTSNGTASPSRSTATAGTQVTLTVSAASGYELDMLRVTTSTSVVSTTNLGGGQYRFTMPAANVEVRASFARKAASSSWTGSSNSSSSNSSNTSSSQSTAQAAVQSVPKLSAWGQIFPDIPASHWAAGEINWANQMGYMNGTANGFNPNGNITFQQMWMVMARLTGSRPASMADARRWAVNGGFADGSAPEGSVTRQQLVTALYRCAHLMGTSNRNTTTLAGFPDSRTVPSVAREPFAWAVANGIIGGNANGRLDPNGTLTRAQFAVILYRFSQRV